MEEEDERFDKMKFDPKFLPIDGRIKTIDDPRFKKVLGPEFSMLGDRDVEKAASKAALRGIYQFAEDGEIESDEEGDDKDEISGSESDGNSLEFVPRKIEIPIELGIIMDRDKEEEDDDDMPLLKEINQELDSEVRAFDLVEQSLANVPETDDESATRFALLNHDFSLVTPKELFVIFQSMCEGKGKVLRVLQYFSKFGEKMASKDAASAPDLSEIFLSAEELEKKKEEKQMEMEASFEEKKKFHTVQKRAKVTLSKFEKLNSHKVALFEMEKLKYYIAVVEFSSASAMLECYDKCNGVDVSDNQTYLDLRIIENSKSFEDYILVDEVAGVDLQTFAPVQRGKSFLYNPSATFQWDLHGQARQRALGGKEDVPDEEILRYINLSDDEEEEDEEELAKIRRILLSRGGGDEDEDEEEDEGESGEEEEMDFENVTIPVHDTVENLALQKQLEDLLVDRKKVKNETYHETRKRRKKEEKKRRRKEAMKPVEVDRDEESEEEETERLRELIKTSRDEEDLEYDLTADRQREMQRVSKKSEKSRDTGFKIDLSGRFDKLLTDPEFNIDPTSKKFRKTKNYEVIIDEKNKRWRKKRKRKDDDEEEEYPKKKQKTE